MATLTTSLVPDNTTATTFRAWSQGIHTAWSTFGWVQTNDTGQAVFTLTTATNITAVGNGVTATYTYVSLTGPAIRVGMSLVITGFVTNAGFNGTFTVTAIGVNSFTINNTTNATETQAAATAVTTLTATPAAGAAVYEIWKAGDGLQATTPIFVKFEYGSNGTNTNPAIFVTVALATDGAGNTTGSMVSSRVVLVNSTNTNTTTASNCYFSGTTASMQMALFNGTTAVASANCFMLLERSKDATGADTSTYFTLVVVGQTTNAQTNYQQSFFNIAGAPPTREISVVALSGYSNASLVFNGTMAVSPIFPLVGAFGNPMLGGIVGKAGDFLDQTTFPVVQYGTSHTYLAFTTSVKAQNMLAGGNQTGAQCLGMRFE